MLTRAKILLAVTLSVAALSLAQDVTNPLPSLDEALASSQDLWGLAAIRQPNGPSYEFFENLLPPLRYVNTEFRHYPIVLSAPNAANKARLVSNGSAINPRANLKTWREVGMPISFAIGKERHLFGENSAKLRGPVYESGHLPIVRMRYEDGEHVFEQESFAATELPFAEHGVVFVKFTLKSGVVGHVSAHIGANQTLLESDGAISITNGIVVWFDRTWKWKPGEKTLRASLSRGEVATLAVATKPMVTGPRTSALDYGKQRRQCVLAWQQLLGRAAQFTVPEPLVNDAWHALLINNFMLLKNDRANYSAGNQYERLYQAECGDTARAFLLFGYSKETLPMLSHQFDYTRENLEFHNAGFKLQQLAHWYWMTRDKAGVESLRAKWEKEINRIVEGREKDSGIFPKERYCGDIGDKVYSLNPNANCWRGLRDFAAVLNDMGEKQRAKELFGFAKEFRAAIMKAVEKSEFIDAKPRFIPIQLFGAEKPYDVLTGSMVGSYWNLLAPYVIGSGVFGPPGNERERAMVDYLHEHSGVCMGMIRFHQHSGLFACEDALDDLYGLRYSIKLLELDEVDRALVSFYGKLAQGLTRDTFIGAEGTGLRPLVSDLKNPAPLPENILKHDSFQHWRGNLAGLAPGRTMYLPPNSTAQAYFLWMLRYLAIQDWDMGDNGRPDTLRLLFATPKRWLEEGKEIKIERAPTAFGEVSLRVKSRLRKGEVVAEVDLPKRNRPGKTLLRIRVPDGWKVLSAKAGRRKLAIDDKGTVDISPLAGKVSLRFAVEKAR